MWSIIPKSSPSRILSFPEPFLILSVLFRVNLLLLSSHLLLFLLTLFLISILVAYIVACSIKILNSKCWLTLPSYWVLGIRIEGGLVTDWSLAGIVRIVALLGCVRELTLVALLRRASLICCTLSSWVDILILSSWILIGILSACSLIAGSTPSHHIFLIVYNKSLEFLVVHVEGSKWLLISLSRRSTKHCNESLVILLQLWFHIAFYLV